MITEKDATQLKGQARDGLRFMWMGIVAAATRGAAPVTVTRGTAVREAVLSSRAAGASPRYARSAHAILEQAIVILLTATLAHAVVALKARFFALGAHANAHGSGIGGVNNRMGRGRHSSNRPQ